MSLLVTRELLVVALLVLAVVAVMAVLSLTQSRRRVRANARALGPAEDDDLPRRPRPR